MMKRTLVEIKDDIIRIIPESPPLFKFGAFTSHSGVHLPDKIDCDALTPADWDTMAAWVARYVDFKAVVGIPTGGLQFAAALERYCKPGGYTLIVDDVLTTGASMEEARLKVKGPSFGVVIFARGQLPNWVIARFIEIDPTYPSRSLHYQTSVSFSGIEENKNADSDPA